MAEKSWRAAETKIVRAALCHHLWSPVVDGVMQCLHCQLQLRGYWLDHAGDYGIDWILGG